jgi:hypothetical protein
MRSLVSGGGSVLLFWRFPLSFTEALRPGRYLRIVVEGEVVVGALTHLWELRDLPIPRHLLQESHA